MPVPENGVVLSGHGAAREWLVANAVEGASIDLSQTDTRLVPAADHQAQFATFVNPLRDDVRAYAQSLITEIVERYDVDGVVLDRTRYASQYADFSPESRAAFEERIGAPVAEWPEDIFEIVFTDTGQEIERGPLFQDWLEFRASVITDFVDDTSALVREIDPDVTYSTYAGAWYPLYWHEGVNWGSRNYQPDLDWAGPGYGATGYAESLDFFMAGTYFEDVTRDEAVDSGRPEDWYSVEGSAEIAMEATDLATFVYGSLFVLQYEDDEDRFRRAMEMAMERTHGLMVFDLVYLEMYDWWHIVAEVLDRPGASPHTNPGFLELVRR
nr:alpha amylase family protein [Phytoactinopolyspora alkaliphila]